MHKAKTTVAAWSRRHAWVERISAHEAAMDREFLGWQRQARREMAERHRRLAGDVMDKAAERLATLEPSELTPRTLVAWLDVAAKIERLALSEPTRHELSGPAGGPIQVAAVLTDEQRRERLAALSDEIGRRLDGAADQPREDT